MLRVVILANVEFPNFGFFCVSYLLLHNKLPQNKQQPSFIISPTFWVKNPEVALPVACAHIGPLMWCQSRCLSGRSHLRVWRMPFSGGWFMWLSAGGHVSFLTVWASLRAAWASLCHGSRLCQGEWLRAGMEGGEESFIINDSRIFFKLLSKVFQVNMLVVISQMRNVCITCIKSTSCSSGTVSFCLNNNCYFNTKS